VAVDLYEVPAGEPHLRRAIDDRGGALRQQFLRSCEGEIAQLPHRALRPPKRHFPEFI
jgi:hypothetical protein